MVRMPFVGLAADNLSRLSFAIAMMLGLALGASSASAEFQVGGYGGWSESFDSDIHLSQPGGTNLTLSDVPWDGAPKAKDWYARVKSRPSFRAILADHIPGLPPPRWYADLDF